MARKNNKSRQLILEKARALFLDRSYRSVRMRDIAEACDMSVALLQHYYPKKENILEAIVYDASIKAGDFIREKVEYKGGGDSKAADACVQFGVLFSMYFSMYYDHNPKLFDMYTEVLFNTLRLKNGLMMMSFRVPSIRREHPANVASFVLCGAVSQLVGLYYVNGRLMIPMSDILRLAFPGSFRLLGLAPEEEESVLERIEAITTDELKDALWKYYYETKSEFVLS